MAVVPEEEVGDPGAAEIITQEGPRGVWSDSEQSHHDCAQPGSQHARGVLAAGAEDPAGHSVADTAGLHLAWT